MKTSLKQWLVRFALALLRGLVFIKHILTPVARTLGNFFSLVGRFLMVVIGIPIFRLFFFLQRISTQLIGIAKGRLSFVAGNSRLIHVAAISITVLVIATNISTNQVRAESFGRQSILYHLVSADDTTDLVTEGPVATSLAEPSTYLADSSIGQLSRQDLTALDEDYASLQNPSEAHVSAPAPQRNTVETYTVADGDTLGSIADHFDLNIETILWANNLNLRSTIRPGQTLTILPIDGVLYTVKKGDTIGKIVKTYGADQDKVLAFNQLADDAKLSAGDSLVLPDGEPPTAAPPTVRPAPIGNLFTPTPNPSGKYRTLSNGQYAASGFASNGPVVFAPPPSNATPAVARGKATGDGSWVWPMDWRIITQYFTWKHTGIDIGGDFTTHSYAAADGTVIYAGWRRGYGMTIEIDNGNGYITRYAHHSELFVKAGDVVKAGQIIGQTGETGNATGPHLHFEVIKDGKFQNPLEYIR